LFEQSANIQKVGRRSKRSSILPRRSVEEAKKNIAFSKTYRAGGDNISFSPFDYAFCDSGAIKCDIVIKNSE